MKLVISLFLALCLSSQAFAAGLVTGKVIKVRIDKTGSGMVFFDQPLSGTPPGCAVAYYNNALAFGNNAAGRAVMALAISAKTSGATVAAVGLGTCAVFGNSVEDWEYGVMQ